MTNERFTSLIPTPPVVAGEPRPARKARGSSKTITCQKCGQRAEPAMKHAIFCKSCSDTLVEEANKPADPDLGDRLFAEMSARRVKTGWRP